MRFMKTIFTFSIMKYTLFTFLLGLMTTSIAFGQFYDPDAQYHSEYYHLGMHEGYATTQILQDTVIDGTTANRLEISAEYWQVNGPGWGNGERVDAGAIDTLITYQSNDSVYVYRDGGFYLAFKTDGTQGDIWDLGQFPQTSNWSGITDDHAYLKVTSVLNTVINGELLRVLTVEPCKQDGSAIDPNNDIVAQVAYGGEINERIGPFTGFLFLGYAFPSNFSEPPRESKLLCYNSTNLGMVDFDTDKDCLNDIESAGITSTVDQNALIVYPNPNAGSLTISTNGTHTFQSWAVFDLSGKLILTKTINPGENEWTIEGLEQGAYNLVLSSANGVSRRVILTE